MATDGWYPPALEDFAAADGGEFINPVTVGVLHKTISRPGGYRPNGRDYFGHQSYPHFTVDVQQGVFKCWQHISIRRAAKALRNEPGGVQTNREGVIQIEIVGWANSDPRLDPAMIEGLSKLMRWIESQTFITPTTDVEWREYPPRGDVRLGREPWRMSFDQWVRYAGWCAHQHTPENSHGDVGAIDIYRLLPNPSQEDDMPLSKADAQLVVDTLLEPPNLDKLANRVLQVVANGRNSYGLDSIRKAVDSLAGRLFPQEPAQ